MKTLKNTFSSYSVKDLDKAYDFYKNLLGLDASKAEMGYMELNCPGDHHVIIYPKPDHEAAGFTVLNFNVENIDEAVDQLISKGINFEQYEAPIKTDSKGISRMENGPSMAWFKDPSGNVISLVQNLNE